MQCPKPFRCCRDRRCHQDKARESNFVSPLTFADDLQDGSHSSITMRTPEVLADAISRALIRRRVSSPLALELMLGVEQPRLDPSTESIVGPAPLAVQQVRQRQLDLLADVAELAGLGGDLLRGRRGRGAEGEGCCG